jgi:hypothetical protein
MAELKFECDPSLLIRSLDDLEGRLAELTEQMPEELTQWQLQDLQRKIPDTEVPEDNTAFTMIYPRSRFSEPHKPLAVHRPFYLRRGRAPKLRRPISSAPRQTRRPSTRPILRPELYVKLCERMMAMLKKAVS